MTPTLTPLHGTHLPIDSVLPEIVASLTEDPTLVLQAPPGAGKTTRVPPALLACGHYSGRILMLEPRRVAARAAARRIAHEWGWTVGHEVGYRMRFERRERADTRILVMTEGTLLASLQADPFLENTSVVLFDEIHERSLDADLALALCRRVQAEARPELALIAMSATLGSTVGGSTTTRASPLAQALGGCRELTTEGRSYPVAIEYSTEAPPGSRRRTLVGEVTAGVRRALGQATGHVLVFLPGVGEIQRAAEALGPLTEELGVKIQKLYGGLPAQEQDAVLQTSDHRKVILSTNVAETSVTIAGVGAVVDSGLARVMRFDSGRGLDRLELTTIARDSADQRAGRAGREGPGYCLRLWSEREHTNRLDHLPPEIHRVDLSGAVLQLFAWGETDLEEFPWVEPPSSVALHSALALLRELGAMGPRGLTPLGLTMAKLPLNPRLSRLVIAGARSDLAEETALVAALLSERDPFRRPERNAEPPTPGDSDLSPRIESLKRLRAGRPSGSTPYGSLLKEPGRNCLRVAKRLQDLAKKSVPVGNTTVEGTPMENLARTLLTAFPDRVARRRDGGDRALLVGGRGLRMGNRTAVRQHPIFLALALRAGRRGAHSEATVDLAVALEPEWLETTFEEAAEVGSGGRVRGFKRHLYRDLALSEKEIPLTDRALIEAALVTAASQNVRRHLPLDDPPIRSFLSRTRSLNEWRPELDLPTFPDEALVALLPSLVLGCRSLAEIRRAPLLDLLRGSMTPQQLQRLGTEAPTHLQMPTGRPQKLDYEPGRPPILAARIQQFFGMKETPTVAGGRIKVLLHLLAPNFRPQQITDDLAGFWTNTYHQVRKQLRGRYPKHAWPKDPHDAR